MDAIFIQSFHKEFVNFKVFHLIERIQKKLKNKNTPILVFTNVQSINIKPTKYLHFFNDKNIKFLYIDEDYALNPTSKIFHFLINFETEKYKRILLLESDCSLKDSFDSKIKENISKTLNEKEWFIYGSHYFGLKGIKAGENPENIDEQRKKNRQHMNGVAVYNRTESFINLINEIFVDEEFENYKTNYDFAFFMSTIDMDIKDKFIDSQLIINLSGEEDTNIFHEEFKPEALVIHTKNESYF